MMEKEKKTALLKSKLCYIFFILIIIFMVVYIILAYSGFIKITDREMERRDGLYRLLDDVPDAMQIILPQWAGIVWFIIDCFIFLVLIYFLDKLLVKAKNYKYGIKNVDY